MDNIVWLQSNVAGRASSSRDLTGVFQANLSFSYFFAHLANSRRDDYLRTAIVESTTSAVLEKHGTRALVGVDWQTHHADNSEFAGQSVYILVETTDAGRGGLVGAGIDSVNIST